MLAIAGGRPETLNLRGILKNYLDFQYENAQRKYSVLLEKELEKKEIKEGLIKACDVIDPDHRDPARFKEFKGRQGLPDPGGHLEHPVYGSRLRALREEAVLHGEAGPPPGDASLQADRPEILRWKRNIRKRFRKIKEYQKILSGRKYMDQVIKEDLKAIKEEFAVPRRTVLEDGREAVYEEPAVEEQEVYFVMDRFGYSKLLDKSTYDRNAETVEAESAYVVHMMNTDKVCLFTHTGVLHQVKAMDIPFGKLRDKGTPIDNLCRYDGTKETVVYVTCAGGACGKHLSLCHEGGHGEAGARRGIYHQQPHGGIHQAGGRR